MQPSPEAIQPLLSAHRQFLAFVERRVESREVAEDILQSAFVRSLERSHEIRDEESVVAWFYRVLRNAVIDHYRSRDARDRALEAWGREMASDDRVDPSVHQEVCGCISDLLGSLKPEYRDALQAVDIEEHSLNELAERSGITAGNAAVRVHRARQALRREVVRACGTCAEHGCVNCECQRGCKSQAAPHHSATEPSS